MSSAHSYRRRVAFAVFTTLAVWSVGSLRSEELHPDRCDRLSDRMHANARRQEYALQIEGPFLRSQDVESEGSGATPLAKIVVNAEKPYWRGIKAQMQEGDLIYRFREGGWSEGQPKYDHGGVLVVRGDCIIAWYTVWVS